MEQGKTLADAEGDVLRGLRESSVIYFISCHEIYVMIQISSW